MSVVYNAPVDAADRRALRCISTANFTYHAQGKPLLSVPRPERMALALTFLKNHPIALRSQIEAHIRRRMTMQHPSM